MTKVKLTESICVTKFGSATGLTTIPEFAVSLQISEYSHNFLISIAL